MGLHKGFKIVVTYLRKTFDSLLRKTKPGTYFFFIEIESSFAIFSNACGFGPS